MRQVALQTESLTKRFGPLVAVNNLNLEVYEGEIFGFLGPNGAGKTTSINMICGLLKPDSGRIKLFGTPISYASADVRSKFGVCPQEIVLWERLSCLEQLKFIGEMYGLSVGQARSRGYELLKALGLEEKESQQARFLSGGMKRRLNLAMALVHDPPIVVLDEPEVGLDPPGRIRVREYIQSLARKQGRTVIVTTHNMDEADRIADRVAIIDRGELLVLDTPNELKRVVGEGDVIEIGLPTLLQSKDEKDLLSALLQITDKVVLNTQGKFLSIRALNAVNLLPIILELLENVGNRPNDVHIRSNTLEDVFIKLTGRGLVE